MGSGKQTFVEQHLAPVCEENGIKQLASLVRELRMSPHSRFHNLVIESVTTHETGFFVICLLLKPLKPRCCLRCLKSGKRIEPSIFGPPVVFENSTNLNDLMSVDFR